MSDTPVIDRVRLRALAEQATPGPWTAKSMNLGQGSFRGVGPELINRAAADRDAAYIAACDPPSILLLLDAADERDRLAARVQELERELKGEHALWLNERAISAGRLKALLIKADEARSEWIRAENAEAQLAAALKGSNP